MLCADLDRQRSGPSSLDTPLFRYPPLALAAQVLAVVGLGVARAALDEIVAIAGDRPSITGAPPLAERAYVQAEIRGRRLSSVRRGPSSTR